MEQVAEPSTRGTNFIAMKSAIEELWGAEALEMVAASMPEEVRRKTIDEAVFARSLLPERYLFAWVDAVDTALARSDRQSMLRFMDTVMDHGFGRVRKLLLSFVSIEKLGRMATELWAYDHTEGTLEVTHTPGTAHLVLRGYSSMKTELHRALIVESLRHVISLARAKDVTSSYEVEADGTVNAKVLYR